MFAMSACGRCCGRRRRGRRGTRERLAGVDVDAVTGADLAAIPTMTKTDVMEHWDEIVTDRRLTLELAEAHLERVASEGPAYLLGEYQVVTTGGSSGRRGVFVWDFEGWLGFGLARERPTFWLRRNAGGDRELRRAFVAAAHSTHPTAILPRTFAGSPQLGVGRSFPATLPLAEIVEGLNRFHPTDLFAYPSMMHRLAGELRRGRLSISPWELNCGAEPLLADARAEIEAAFGRPVMNLYAAAEVGVIARSYPGSAGLHLNEDIAVYEPVDADIRPVAAGTTAAKLLVTNVINHAIPLIRYELADELTVLAEPNPGPWTGRRIADIEGRVEGTFVYDGEVEIHLHLFRSALGRRRQMLEYQVRQTPAGADIAVRTSARLDTDALSRELVNSSHGARCRPPSGEHHRGREHRAHRIDGKASSLHPARSPARLTARQPPAHCRLGLRGVARRYRCVSAPSLGRCRQHAPCVIAASR